jgi:WD40 repeat protein
MPRECSQYTGLFHGNSYSLKDFQQVVQAAQHSLFTDYHREKVLSKSSSELCESGTSLPRAVSFCSSGKSIAVGCSEGELLVLDIATSEVLKAIRPHGLLARRGILFVTWVQNADSNLNSCSGCQLDGVVQMWRYGGVNLVDRYDCIISHLKCETVSVLCNRVITNSFNC